VRLYRVERGRNWRKYLGTLVLALNLLAGSCSAVSQLPAKLQAGFEAQRSYEAGLEKYNAKEYGAAIPHFKRTLDLEPTFDDAAAYLAWSIYYTADYTTATRHFRQALLRQPRWEGLHNGLGWSRYRVGRYHIALEAFQEALGLDPTYRDAAVGMAYSLFELGRYAEAIPHLERLTREGEGSAFQRPAPDLENVRSRYAWSLLYVGDFERARVQFVKGVAARPDWYGLHNGLGWAYLQSGDRTRAQQSFRRALQLKPDLADAQEGLKLARP
jgi:tetratricopeptide (TPR) repeat protein